MAREFCGAAVYSKSSVSWGEMVTLPVGNHLFPVRTDFKLAVDGNH